MGLVPSLWFGDCGLQQADETSNIIPYYVRATYTEAVYNMAGGEARSSKLDWKKAKTKN